MGDHEAKKPKVNLSNRSYDLIKWVAQILLPAFAALYLALAGIWGLPNPEQVVGTVAAVDTFLGVLLGLTKRSYDKSDRPYDGDFVVDQSDPETDRYSLDIHSALENIGNQKSIKLKVKPPAGSASQD